MNAPCTYLASARARPAVGSHSGRRTGRRGANDRDRPFDIDSDRGGLVRHPVSSSA